jgi:(S)-ureidoglycine aminohydrolase
VRRPSHLLHTPDAFIRTRIPGCDKVSVIVHVSPAMGAAFTQYTAEFEPGGSLGDAAGQRFIYVLEGAVEIDCEGQQRQLAKDAYAYLPQGAPHLCTSPTGARAAIIEKPYTPIAQQAAPTALFGREPDLTAQPLLNDEQLLVRTLLPDTFAFDFAVNTLIYQPGAALPLVEMHVMEHGLLMLDGGGIYKLDQSWYPVTAGDFIWMAPYCPQWFGALGRTPAKYLLYKDWNRHPLA